MQINLFVAYFSFAVIWCLHFMLHTFLYIKNGGVVLLLVCWWGWCSSWWLVGWCCLWWLVGWCCLWWLVGWCSSGGWWGGAASGGWWGGAPPGVLVGVVLLLVCWWRLFLVYWWGCSSWWLVGVVLLLVCWWGWCSSWCAGGGYFWCTGGRPHIASGSQAGGRGGVVSGRRENQLMIAS